ALGDAVLRLSDSAAELSSYLSGFDELAETSLEETEARRAELGTLAPYGQDVAEVLDFEARSAAELAELEAEDRDLDGLDAALDRTRRRGPRPRRPRRRRRRTPPHPRGRRLRTHRDPHPHGR